MFLKLLLYVTAVLFLAVIATLLIPGYKAIVSTREDSVVVAVLDSGIDEEHPNLAAYLERRRDGKVHGYNVSHPNETARDELGHGTHVAGVIVNEYARLTANLSTVPRLRILPVKIVDQFGLGSTAKLALGIRWAADNGADIINISAGTTKYNNSVAEAVAYAWSRGSLIVAAAGDTLDKSRTYPAALPFVLSVGAIGLDGQPMALNPVGERITVLARGESVESIMPTYAVSLTQYGFASPGTAKLSGTSQATAMVSGVAAAFKARLGHLNVQQLYDQIVWSARTASKDKYISDYGIVNPSLGLHERLSPKRSAGTLVIQLLTQPGNVLGLQHIELAAISRERFTVSARVDTDGIAYIREIKPGRYSFRVLAKTGRQIQKGTVVVRPGTDTMLSLQY